MNKKALLINIERPLVQSFVSALEEASYTTDIIESYSTSFQETQSSAYTLTFLSFKKPEEKELEILKAIRELKPSTPTYILTDYNPALFAELKKEAYQQFPLSVRPRPTAQDQVLTLVQEALRDQIL